MFLLKRTVGAYSNTLRGPRFRIIPHLVLGFELSFAVARFLLTSHAHLFCLTKTQIRDGVGSKTYNIIKV